MKEPKELVHTLKKPQSKIVVNFKMDRSFLGNKHTHTQNGRGVQWLCVTTIGASTLK